MHASDCLCVYISDASVFPSLSLFSVCQSICLVCLVWSVWSGLPVYLSGRSALLPACLCACLSVCLSGPVWSGLAWSGLVCLPFCLLACLFVSVFQLSQQLYAPLPQQHHHTSSFALLASQEAASVQQVVCTFPQVWKPAYDLIRCHSLHMSPLLQYKQSPEDFLPWQDDVKPGLVWRKCA